MLRKLPHSLAQGTYDKKKFPGTSKAHGFGAWCWACGTHWGTSTIKVILGLYLIWVILG